MIFEQVLPIIFIVTSAVVLHEFAHGWVAHKLGDPTAKLAGRLTLNPIKHIDLVGSILVPGFLFLMYFFGVTQTLMLFGWAKPVPVNFRALNNPKRDMMLVAIAGPIVNVALAFVFGFLLRINVFVEWSNALMWAVFLNLGLAIFNLIPIPPLDGSRIVTGLLPHRLAYQYNKIEPYGIFILLILLNFGLLKFVWPLIIIFARLFGAI